MDMNKETSGSREAQVKSQDQSNINNLTMNNEKKIKINMKEVSDMIWLIDGKLIVVELCDKLSLPTPDGKLENKLYIPGAAFSVKQIYQDTIAIKYHHEQAINISNIENEIVTKVIILDEVCCGLSLSDNSLVVGLGDDEIRIIDLEGNTLKVIYSDYDGNAVNCVDGSGKQIWQYTQNLERQWEIYTDTYGNIIVVDHDSHRIKVISKDWQDSKVLLSDGLANPSCIYLQHNDSSGFTCDFDGKYLTKLNLSPG
ncbi:unnamed protein product [Mytilus coruscus]|uniref:TRIM2_3 n=1 Tax=Mytilus coruscus TaxID=42192 RepID=A0A6J8ATB5_MYTCO|nr:unnamed protein product [Mytilus coruscus]